MPYDNAPLCVTAAAKIEQRAIGARYIVYLILRFFFLLSRRWRRPYLYFVNYIAQWPGKIDCLHFGNLKPEQSIVFFHELQVDTL